MRNPSERRSFWRSLPLIGVLVAEWRAWRDEINTSYCHLGPMTKQGDELPPYPLNMYYLLALPHGVLDENGVPYNSPIGEYPATYQSTTIAQYGLAQWNSYLETASEQHQQAFLTQANWLVEHEVQLDGDTSGWPIPYPSSNYHAPGPWLSALTQGNVVSVLLRAYRLTGDERFLKVARRGVRTFERDILDGGVSTFLGKDGVFFEEVAVYPAAHILNGYVLALFGLYDYVALTDDSQINELIQRSLATLHSWIDEYDTGYWSRYDLHYRHHASLFYHDLHICLLQALARLSGCAHCEALAARWKKYQQRTWCRFRHYVASRLWRYRRRLQRALFKRSELSAAGPIAVCVPLPAFSFADDMSCFLVGVEETMAGDWQMEYVPHRKSPGGKGISPRSLGSAIFTPWQFPSVWLSVFSGWRVLLSLFARRRGYYRLVLSQDGVFTGAFAALAAKLAGIRVVCMEYGTVLFTTSEAYHADRLYALQSRPWLVRLILRLLFLCYWPSLRFLARIAARYTDALLVASDEVAETYRRELGVAPSKIIPFPFIPEVQRYSPLDSEHRANPREQQGIAPDAIVITMGDQFSSPDGIDTALKGISRVLPTLLPEERERVRVLIVGSGPLRRRVEEEVQRLGLGAICRIWGETTPEEAVTLLEMTDIFLSTAMDGLYPLAVYEAMAAGCAVVAPLQPMSLAHLLADGRGIPVPAEDVGAVSAALRQTISDPALCRQLGQQAREYIAHNHGANALQRCLRQAAFWWMSPTEVLQKGALESVTAGDRQL